MPPVNSGGYAGDSDSREGVTIAAAGPRAQGAATPTRPVAGPLGPGALARGIASPHRVRVLCRPNPGLAMRSRPLLLALALVAAAGCSHNRVLLGRDQLAPARGDTLAVHSAAMPAGEVRRVTLRVRSGAVVVAAGRDDSVRATLAVGRKGSWRGHPCDPERAAAARVAIERDADGVVVTSSPNLGDRCHEYWHVEVPSRVALDARAEVARLVVDGVAGGVKLSVAVGEIAATVPRGDVDAEVRSVGDVDVRTATDDYADASAEADVGDVLIEVDAHRVDAAQAPGPGGRVGLRGRGRDRLRVRSGVGDATLRIGRAVPPGP